MFESTEVFQKVIKTTTGKISTRCACSGKHLTHTDQNLTDSSKGKAGRDETYDYYYKDTELNQIKGRIERLSEVFESLTVIANNHYKGAELANALELKALLTGRKQPVPEGLLKTYPKLSQIALEQSLFDKL